MHKLDLMVKSKSLSECNARCVRKTGLLYYAYRTNDGQGLIKVKLNIVLTIQMYTIGVTYCFE